MHDTTNAVKPLDNGEIKKIYSHLNAILILLHSINFLYYAVVVATICNCLQSIYGEWTIDYLAKALILT